MGLKVSTLAAFSLSGKSVMIHGTGEKASVIATHVNGNIVFSLRFKNDGRVEEVMWSADNQGFVSPKGDLEEDITTPAPLS